MTRLSYIVTIISIALICVCAEELHSDKYDEDNAERILEDATLRDQFVNCLLDISPCDTDEMKLAKEVFGEAVLTDCKKCTAKQRSGVNIMKDWFTKNKPEQWKAILAKSREDMRKRKALVNKY